MVVHPASDRVPRARPYSGAASAVWDRRSVRGPNPLRPALPGRSGRRPPSAPGAGAPGRAALQPRRRLVPRPWRRSPVWPSSPFARRYSGNLVIDFSSSGYLDVSVPRVAPSEAMCSPRRRRTCVRRVRPFGDPGIEGRVRLPRDYRGLPRPSSAPCAKASAVRPWYLPARPARGPMDDRMSYIDTVCSVRAILGCRIPSRRRVAPAADQMLPRAPEGARSCIQQRYPNKDGESFNTCNVSVGRARARPLALCGSQGARGDAPGTGDCGGTHVPRTGRLGREPAPGTPYGTSLSCLSKERFSLERR